jgi:ABC-type Mn2+/Zn2+ transport system permease subunit
MALTEFFLEPLTYRFMQSAFITSIAVGILASTLSVVIVLRGWALLGDAISHAVLPGLAAAAVFNIPLTLGGALAGVVSSLAIGFIEQKTRVRNDTAIGIVLTGAFALGLVAISKLRPTLDVFHILFGNVLAVSTEELQLTAAVAAVVLLFFGLFLKEIVAYTFDPVFASVVGLPSNILHHTLMVMISLAVIASLQTVGIILVVALLITPGATAQLLAKNLPQMFIISIAVGITSAIIGLYLSFYLAASSGGTIALTATTIFFAAFVAKRLAASAVSR